MLLAYDEEGNVIATLDDVRGVPAERLASGVWVVGERPVKGSKAWPERLGGRAHDYRVELRGPAGRRRIHALIHKETGQRRTLGD